MAPPRGVQLLVILSQSDQVESVSPRTQRILMATTTPPVARPVSAPSGVPAICAALAVALICGVIFQPVLMAGFVSRDDGAYLRQAGRLSDLKLPQIRAAFSSYCAPSETGGYYQPLTLLSLALDARLATDPTTAAFQFHLTNLALHLANVMLMFVLLRQFGAGIGACAIGALLFGLHPTQTASVAWVSQRMTLLGGFFALCSLISYARLLRTGGTMWVVYATILYAAAILANPILIPLPVLMLLLDLWPGRRTGWAPVIEKAPMLAILLISAVLQFTVHARRPGIISNDLGSLEVLGGSLVSFTRRIFWPTTVSVFYPADRVLASSGYLAAMVAIGAAIIVGGVWSFKRSRAVFTALCGTVAIVCPAMLDAAYADSLLGDKYLYFVLVAPLIVMAVSVRTIAGPVRRRMIGYAGAAVVAFCATHAYLQTFAWLSSRDMYEETVKRYPAWAKGYNGLVEACLQDSDLDAALQYARRAVRVAPQDPDIQFYLGTTLLLHRDGRSAEAIAPLRKALRSNENWIACLQNLGVALIKSGHTDKAIAYLEKARDLDPSSAAIRTGLGHAYLRVHRPAAARAELQEALRQKNDPIIHLGLAMAWAENDADEQARRHLAIALTRDPKLAGRAAASPALRRLGDASGWLHGATGDGEAPMLDAELPAARRAGGPTG